MSGSGQVASRIRHRRRAASFDDDFAAHLEQVLDEELARRTTTVTVTALPKRLPAEPLVWLVEGRGGLYACLGPADRGGGSRLDRAYRQACACGHLTWRAADQLAIELLGLHPSLVWGDTWFDAEANGISRQV